MSSQLSCKRKTQRERERDKPGGQTKVSFYVIGLLPLYALRNFLAMFRVTLKFKCSFNDK